MLTYAYKARDLKTGKQTKGEMQAENEKSAARLLTERGLSPLEIKVKAEGSGAFGNSRSKVKSKQKVIFSRQLSTLVNAGLPLVQSLETVRGQTESKTLKKVIESVITDVESGSTFADALSRHPRVFNTVYISLVAAGEASGTLDVSLERLANQQEKDAEIISKVRGALIYPFIVILVLVAVVTFMLVTVLPEVQNLYDSLPGAELPFVTKFLLAVSNIVIHYWWVILIVVGAGAFFSFRWGRTLAGKRTTDELKLRVWPIAPLYRKLYMARFARTGATLVASGVPMIKMLNVTAEAVDNVLVAESINKATEQVKGGKALSASLEGDPYFLDLVPDMIKIGEQSGQLESMLGKVADYYEKEVDNQIKAISTIIEPVLMIFVGIMALIVVAAILLPIYSLASNNLLK